MHPPIWLCSKDTAQLNGSAGLSDANDEPAAHTPRHAAGNGAKDGEGVPPIR
jgi:hypothetical protein